MKVEEDVTYDPANPTNTEVPENTEVLSDEEEPQIRSESMVGVGRDRGTVDTERGTK